MGQFLSQGFKGGSLELEIFYGALAVVMLVGLIFVLAVCQELRQENRSYIGKISYLEDLLKKK